MAPRHSQRGFSLLEVLLAVSIAIALGSLQLGQIRRDTENIQARAVGEQLKMVGNALNSYITLQYGNITNLTDAPDPGTVADPGFRDCEPGMCIIQTRTLQRMGLLPSSFSGRNAYGSEYRYQIRITGSAPNWQVEGMVITDQPYTIGGNPRFDLIGQAMLAAGADSGTTRTLGTRIDGFNGSWSDINYDTGDQLGQLAFRAGYGTSNFAAFLRLDGSTPMQSDLDMGNNDIENANNITADGVVQASSIQTQEVPGAIMIGNSASASRGQLGVASTGGMVALNDNGFQVMRLDGVTPSALVAGDARFEALRVVNGTNLDGNVRVGGTTQLVGAVTTDNRLQVQGDITTLDGSVIVAGPNRNISVTNGNITATGSGATNGVITSRELLVNENARVNGALRLGSTGAQWAFNTMSEVELSGANLRARGDVLAHGNVYAEGNIGAVNNLLLGGGTTAGAPCATGTLPTTGGTATTSAQTFRASTSGQLLQCIGGTWQAAGGINNSQTIAGTAVGSGGTSYATCPAGFKVAGGGFTLVFRGTVSDPYSPASSYADPTGNRWVVQAGAGHGSQFQASALCVN